MLTVNKIETQGIEMAGKKVSAHAINNIRY